MIVQQNTIPAAKYPSASSRPPKTIQRMFRITELVFVPSKIFFPNGKNETQDNLKH